MRHRTKTSVLLLTFWLLLLAPDARAQWQSLGLSGHQLNKLRICGSYLYACTTDGLHRLPTSAADTTWNLLAFAGESVLDLTSIGGPDTLLAAKALSGAPADTVSLFRSTDSGLSWVPFQNNFGAGGHRRARKLHSLEGGTVLAASGRIEKFTDGGLTWRVVTQAGVVNALESSPANPQVVWCGGETVIFQPYILKSTDAGETWKDMNLFAGGDNAVDAIAGHPTDADVVYLGMEGRVMKSEDGGASWLNMTSPDPSLYTFGMAIRPVLPLKVYAAGGSFVPDPRGVVFYQSSDGGISWQDFSYPAGAGYGATQLLLEMGPAEETLYVATYNGVFRFTQVPVDVQEQSSSPWPEARGSICALYPSPATRMTNVRFVAGSDRSGILMLFDVSGRVVRQLRLEQFASEGLAEGESLLQVDVGMLPSGIYFLRLADSRGEPLGAPKKLVISH
jgi:photosystem II stability/assembly factor-like uncharacterized protein